MCGRCALLRSARQSATACGLLWGHSKNTESWKAPRHCARVHLTWVLCERQSPFATVVVICSDVCLLSKDVSRNGVHHAALFSGTHLIGPSFRQAKSHCRLTRGALFVALSFDVARRLLRNFPRHFTPLLSHCVSCITRSDAATASWRFGKLLAEECVLVSRIRTRIYATAILI